MPNLRVIYDNAADRATTLGASTTEGSLVAAYMQTDYKGEAHRSTGTSVTYTLTWTDGEDVGGVFLPATNLTADSTIRVRLYSDTACTALLADSGTVYACAGLELGMWDWNQPLNANAFAFGGASKSQVWFTEQQFAKGCVIDLVDTGNPAGYIDCARLVVGAYWETEYNPDYGAEVTPVDTTENSRNGAGDNMSDRGVMTERLSLELRWLKEADRAMLMRIARSAGTSRNIAVSMLPGDSSPVAEQDWCIFGKRDNSGVSATIPLIYSSTLDLESW